MTVSKTLGGGLPLAGAITTPAIGESVYDKHFNFYTSHVPIRWAPRSGWRCYG